MLSAHPGNFKFFRAENSVIRFLTVCSGTSRNKIFADKNDVIIAHKTYLKLIKTDLTRINPLKDPSIYKVNEWEDIFPNKKEKTNNKNRNRIFSLPEMQRLLQIRRRRIT